MSKNQSFKDQLEELQTLVFVPKHPNILSIVAVCHDFQLRNTVGKKSSAKDEEKKSSGKDDAGDKLAIVMEYQEHGSLTQFVEKCHAGNKKIIKFLFLLLPPSTFPCQQHLIFLAFFF